MPLLVLKVVLTPLVVGGASLGARRWGPTAGGWIVSLPLTSGPVALFLALDRGPAFAAQAASASLAGCLAIAAYTLAYARAARLGWPRALLAGGAGWLAGALVAQVVASWPVAVVLVGAVSATAAGRAMMPPPDATGGRPNAGTGSLDVLVRMAVAAMVVVGVTEAAPVVGAAVSGVLAMLPIIGSILAVFAQRAGGPGSGVEVQRGILSGLFGTAAFLAVVAWGIVPYGVVPAFLAAIGAVALVQTVSLRLLASRGATGRSTVVGPVVYPPA